MGDQHGILALQLFANFITVERFLLRRQRLWLLGIEVSLDKKSFGNVRHVVRAYRDLSARDVEYTARRAAPVGTRRRRAQNNGQRRVARARMVVHWPVFFNLAPPAEATPVDRRDNPPHHHHQGHR